jgi:hypothetical protein
VVGACLVSVRLLSSNPSADTHTNTHTHTHRRKRELKNEIKFVNFCTAKEITVKKQPTQSGRKSLPTIYSPNDKYPEYIKNPKY